MRDKDRFTGKVAVITGAAGGIGSATARRLAAEGASIAILDLNGDGAVAVAQSLPDAIGLRCDVADDKAVDAAMAAVIDRWGGIDILVNNAGGTMRQPGPLWDFTPDEIRRATDINYHSQFFCMKAVMPSMRDRGGGAIVNISSGSGVKTVEGMAAYGAAKAAVINITQAAAREFGQFNIRVNAIAPGYIRFAVRAKQFTQEQADFIAQQAMKAQALKQVGEPDDIAAAVAFLCSPDARHISGAILPVNGG